MWAAIFVPVYHAIYLRKGLDLEITGVCSSLVVQIISSNKIEHRAPRSNNEFSGMGDNVHENK